MLINLLKYKSNGGSHGCHVMKEMNEKKNETADVENNLLKFG